ncbi:MAG: surface carbohydrate biosynthesis protein [Pseudomonadota bacterium]
MSGKASIILPSETWAREFDAKLLLACCLAERGYQVYVGCKNTIHLNITQFPASLYFAKDFRVSSDTMFYILKKLGHQIVAWDEEATLPFDADEYHAIRISPAAFSKVSAFFAWGQVNKETIESAPYPVPGPVYLTGNPRRDMSRPEIREYFRADAEALRARFGRFILINSNFGKLNHFTRAEVVLPGQADPALRGRPNSPKFEKKGELKYELYQHFLELVPKLAAEFGDMNIVIRPHPSESHESWREAAGGASNVEILYEGHVYPWLMASEVMIHSGCTTGMEGYMLETPVVSYMPVSSQQSEENLPNKLSHRVYSYSDLIEATNSYLSGARQARQSAALDKLVEPYILCRDDRTASDEIAELVDEFLGSQSVNGQGSIDSLVGWGAAKMRTIKKRIDQANPKHKSNLAFDFHRFPIIQLEDVSTGVERFRTLLDRFDRVRASEVQQNIFLISP